jgi:hypothetical protein
MLVEPFRAARIQARRGGEVHRADYGGLAVFASCCVNAAMDAGSHDCRESAREKPKTLA